MHTGFVRESDSLPPWGRVLVLAPVVWWTVALGSGISTWCFLDYVNLAFHEAGHVFLAFAGKTLHYLGGTLGQLIVPALLVVHFLVRSRRPFAAALCAWWLGESLVNVSVYMADARSLALPLVGGGDHDWNELLYRFGMLTEPAVRNVSGATRGLGCTVMLLGLAWAAYFVAPADLRGRVHAGLTSRWPWIEHAL
jgi:hypothetical protein